MKLKLLIKFTDDWLSCQVLEMQDKWRNNLKFKASNGFIIASDTLYPEIRPHILYLRGDYREYDDKIVIINPGSKLRIEELFGKIKVALKELSQKYE